jgi:hypothetical protein
MALLLSLSTLRGTDLRFKFTRPASDAPPEDRSAARLKVLENPWQCSSIFSSVSIHHSACQWRARCIMYLMRYGQDKRQRGIKAELF